MNREKLWWVLVALLWTLPYLLLLTAGTVWLIQHGWFWPWLAITGMAMLAGWPLLHWLRSRLRPAGAKQVRPAERWPPTGNEAWQKVDAFAERRQAEDLPLDRPDAIFETLREVLRIVAAHYHPRSKQPLLEVPVAHVCRIAELVSRDLRVAVAEHVPGSHILTLHDLDRARKLAGVSKQLYLLYRILYFGLNPPAGLLREARQAAAGGLTNLSVAELRRWAIGFCIRKAGFYAIELYSGNLTLEDVDVAGRVTAASQQDLAADAAREAADDGEPLRMLVLGQAKAGKSSLVNAMFGEVRAAVDVVPCTAGVEPYVLEREGIRRAIILDTAGYAAGESPGEPSALSDEFLECDLVLLVVSATSAAREADRRLLEAAIAQFHAAPDRVMPPVLAAVTHIDLLRPVNQWDPPYDLDEARDAKARNIRTCVEAVSEDLGLTTGEVVPVCLADGRLYNVEEGLVPAIVHRLPQAVRGRYLRCLQEHHRQDYWSRLWRQAQGSGRLLWQAGKTALSRLDES